VYCLGGGRSAEAASLMRSEGFTKVVELEGGMMKWRTDGLKEVATSVKSAGMSMSDFNKLMTSDKKVFVDFYAEWCAPCRKMKPALEEISAELKETIEVVRINVDENTELCKSLKIDALPVLHLYKDGKRTWEHKGYLDKQGMLDAIGK
jgi:thioredoxin